jgi:CRISPR-associated protein Cmr3
MRIFIEPAEPLLFRTGRPFDAGETNYAQTLFPPTPETLQGAIRAAIATHWDGSKTLAEAFQDPTLTDLIGDRNSYGRFRITAISLGRYKKQEQADKEPRPPKKIERLFPMPAHILQEEQGDKRQIRLSPESREGIYTDIPEDMQLLYPTEHLENRERKLKPMKGWLTERGLYRALGTNEDLLIEKEAQQEEKCEKDVDVVKEHNIYVHEARLGIGMENATKATKDGLLYQMQMIRMNPQMKSCFIYGFVVDIRLAQPSKEGRTLIQPGEFIDDDETQKLLNLPGTGWITLGGERRAARFEIIKTAPAEQQGEVEQKMKGNILYLATPAAFKRGWRPEEWTASLAKPIAAAIEHYQSIGGWLLTPGSGGGTNKTMRRCLPAGSVYFFKEPVEVTQHLTDYGWQIGYGITYAGEQ